MLATMLLTAIMGGKGGGNSWGTGAGQKIGTGANKSKIAQPPNKKNNNKQNPAGENRKSPPAKGTVPSDPKSLLNNGVMIIKGSPPAKGDIVYTVEEAGGEVTATVSITCLDEQHEVKGSPVTGNSKANKKEAEQNAAEAATAKLQDAIDAKEPERLAKRKDKEDKREENRKIAQSHAADAAAAGHDKREENTKKAKVAKKAKV